MVITGTAMGTDGDKAIMEIRVAIRSPSSATFQATTLRLTEARFRSSRIESTKAPQLILPMANWSVWQRGCSGTVSTTEQVRAQLTRLSFHLASLLAATGVTPVIPGEARGRRRSTTTTTPPAGTTIMRLLALVYSDLNITIFLRTGA